LNKNKVYVKVSSINPNCCEVFVKRKDSDMTLAQWYKLHPPSKICIRDYGCLCGNGDND
jgi:hypothetical protein